MSEKYQLSERSLSFSVAVIRHCSRYSKQPTLRSTIDQVVQSATSIGANYAEANNAASKVDFKNKIFIAKKEAAETEYWLTILQRLGDNTEELVNLKTECHEMLMILQKIINTLRDKTKWKL